MHNIRSIRNKFEEIEALPKTQNYPEVIALTETWLTENEEHLYNIHGYKGIFRSRPTRGGGIALYIKSNLNFKILLNCFINKIEIITVKLNTQNIAITLIYKPPQVNFNTLEDTLQNNILNRRKSHIIMGDFNINIMEKNQLAQRYKNMYRENNYNILNKTTKQAYTRHSQDSENSILDHVITNIQTKQIKLKIIKAGLSDHNAIRINMNNKTSNTKDYKILNITRRDESGIKRNLEELENKNIKDFEQLSKAIKDIIDKNEQTIKIRRREECPWITKEVIKEIRKRNKLYSKHRKNINNQILHERYKEQKKQTTDFLKQSKIKYFKTMFQKHCLDYSKTWKLINQELGNKNKTRNQITEIKSTDGIKITNQTDIVNEINNYFASVGKILAEEQISTSRLQPQTTTTLRKNIKPQLSCNKTDNREIEQIISKMKKNKAPGFDGITNDFIIKHRKFLIPTLNKLINNTLKSGIYPEYLKQTIIIPVHKKGNRDELQNYRPISLLSSLNKILEKVIHNRMSDHISANNIIYKQQYAFQTQSGTTSAVLDIIENIANNLNKKKITVVVFIDLKKAFDTISKDKLNEKLQKYKLNQHILELTESYLKNRPQKICMENIESKTTMAPYGIPQGGNLPPLLYILYTNDLCELALNGVIYGYADDTCLVYTGTDQNILETNINKDLQKVQTWCYNNLLTINELKTEYMIFKTTKQKLNLQIKLQNHILRETSTINYLGLKIQNNLKWDAHVVKLKNENIRTIAALIKIQKLIPNNMRKPLYHALFTSRMNYLMNIWSNTTEKNLNALQRQQNKILKLIYKLHKRTPTHILFDTVQELDIKQLILFNSLLLLYKIKNNTIKTNIKLNTNKEVHNYQTRRKSHIRSYKVKNKTLTQRLTTKTIQTFNGLTEEVKNLKFIQFKKRIKWLILNKTVH